MQDPVGGADGLDFLLELGWLLCQPSQRGAAAAVTRLKIMLLVYEEDLVQASPGPGL